MTDCDKIITDKKRLKELGIKSFGQRHIIMQKRAEECQKSKIRRK